MTRQIIISGGSSGIGAAIIQRLLAQNCRIFNLDVVAGTAPEVIDIQCDLADPSAIDRAIEQLPGAIDGLINVAGIAPDNHDPLDVMKVNFLGMRHLLSQSIDRLVDDAAVVIVASSAGRDWWDNRTQVDGLLDTADFHTGVDWLNQYAEHWEGAAYQFSKQCAAAFTYRAAGLARQRRVRVNCINPGIVQTALTPAFRDMLGEVRFDEIVGKSGRAGTPEDIAPVAEYLLLGDCHWLNGVELTVDGGYYAGLVGGWIEPS